MTLCGISSRFQLLSPSERQVAHVLLTRPPLIREQAPFTVRLACVRRAASVRPEPGSNSLKFVSNRGFPRSNLAQINKRSVLRRNLFIRNYCFFSSETFQFQESTRSYFVLHIVQFSRNRRRSFPLSHLSVSAALSRRLDYYITFFCICQALFSNFLKNFQKSLKFACFRKSLRDTIRL